MKIIKSSFYRWLLLVFAVSCTTKSGNEGVTFSIGSYHHELNFEDVVLDFTPVALRTDDEFLLGRIRDVCFTDRHIYVVDAATAAVFIFDKKTGDMVKSILQKGAGPNEYINPWAIDCDTSNVYLLDNMSRIIAYDKELNFRKVIHIPQIAFDFIRTGNGFLLRSAILKAYKFVYIDMNGNELAKYIPVTAANDEGRSNYGDALELLWAGKKSWFCDGYRGVIYTLDDDKEMHTAYTLDFGRLNIPDNVNPNNYPSNEFPYIYKPTFFLFSNQLIVDFFAPNDNNRYYSFMNLSTGAQRLGRIKYLDDTPPFFPQKQDNENLVGLFTYGDISNNHLIMDKLLKTTNVAELDSDTPVLIFYTLNPQLCNN
jgi:hypothetical protein